MQREAFLIGFLFEGGSVVVCSGPTAGVSHKLMADAKSDGCSIKDCKVRLQSKC